jgi:hypothetical protein
LVVTEPVVLSEFVARVREVTAELRELIPRVAWIAGRARALLDADVFDTVVDERPSNRSPHCCSRAEPPRSRCCRMQRRISANAT